MAEAPPAPSERFTRCPGCGTLFRVTSQQLGMRGGRVRCGQCKTVFDGNAPIGATVPGASVEIVAEAPVSDSALPRPPEAHAGDTPFEAPPAAAPTPALFPQIGGAAGAGHRERATPPTRRARPRAMNVVWAIAIPLLAVLLAAQAVLHFSSAIAAQWPVTAPVLTRVCEVAGCSVRPLRDASMQHLAIEASDLQADPAHKGLLLLTATIRNRAAGTYAWPHLELMLTDAQDQLVVRRVLAPSEYAGGTVDIARGIAANGAVDIRLFIDASAIVPAGYRLYLFYP